MKFLGKLEYKYGKYAIENLIKYIIGAQVVVFILALFTGNQVLYLLNLDVDKIMAGQIWRIVTFAMMPITTSLIWAIFAFLIMHLLGSALEREWGSFKFNIYYFSAIILTNIAAFIGRYVIGEYIFAITGYYIYLSLFLAFATLYPNYTFNLFLILPVKVKWLAYLDALLIAWAFITSGWGMKLVIVASVINYFIFFGEDLYNFVFKRSNNTVKKRNYQTQIHVVKQYTHKCAVCGLTDKDNPRMVFRYCSKCEGQFAYCTEHMINHEHVKKA
jgi:hypothetical protein